MDREPVAASKLSQADFARLQGWSKSYVSKLKKESRLVLDDAGLVDVAPTLALITGTTTAPERAATSVVSTAFNDSRDRKEHYTAELARLDYLERAGKLLDAGEVVGVIADALTTLRSAIEAAPPQLAPQLAAMGDEAQMRALLADHFEVLLAELADTLGKLGQAAGEGTAS
jgi:transcriptional regulator with XRE-family HTH domain